MEPLNSGMAEFFEMLPEDFAVELQKIDRQYKPKTIGLAYGGGRGHNTYLRLRVLQ